MTLTDRKLAHFERTAREHPEYRDVLSLFRAVYAYVSGKEDATGISFAVPAARRSRSASEGLSLLLPDDIRVDGGKAAAWVRGIVGVLRAATPDGEAGLAALDRALADGGVDLRPLFAAWMARDRGVVTETAVRLSVQPALLEFVIGFPLKTALERFAQTVDPGGVAGWERSNCPVCGGRAGMDELVGEEGKRFLCCSACFFKWSFRRLECAYCGNTDSGQLSYFTAGDGPTRVGVCRKCGRYIKTRDSRVGNADVPLDAEDIATLHLDLLAGREGFERGT